MIVDALLKVLHFIVKAGWDLVPDWTVSIPSEATGLVTEMSKWNAVVPFVELMQITSAVASFFVAMVAFKIIMKVIDLIAAVIP